MRVGTKSLLFGGHQFLVHPFFVALSWIWLYGLSFDPRVWISIFVHDWGYWGKENMDGEEGKTHPELGAGIVHKLFDRYEMTDITYTRDAFGYSSELNEYRKKGWRVVDSLYLHGDTVNTLLQRRTHKWKEFVLYHSRSYAQMSHKKMSKLCLADKLAFLITPSWLYLGLCSLTGEREEYVEDSEIRERTPFQWVREVKKKTKKWVNFTIRTQKIETLPTRLRRGFESLFFPKCPLCKRGVVRYERTDQLERTSIDVYTCSYCKKEFI